MIALFDAFSTCHVGGIFYSVHSAVFQQKQKLTVMFVYENDRVGSLFLHVFCFPGFFTRNAGESVFFERIRRQDNQLEKSSSIFSYSKERDKLEEKSLFSSLIP